MPRLQRDGNLPRRGRNMRECATKNSWINKTVLGTKIAHKKKRPNGVAYKNEGNIHVIRHYISSSQIGNLGGQAERGKHQEMGGEVEGYGSVYVARSCLFRFLTQGNTQRTPFARSSADSLHFRRGSPRKIEQACAPCADMSSVPLT